MRNGDGKSKVEDPMVAVEIDLLGLQVEWKIVAGG